MSEKQQHQPEQQQTEPGVYPAAPPTYAEAVPTEPSAPQPIPTQSMHIPPVQPQTIVIVQNSKLAPSFEPYVDFCPSCQTNVTTRVDYTMGFCSWTLFFLGLFIFFPLLCCFCLESFRDAKHYCPNCGTCISVKRR